jgi:MFS family permease
VAEVVRHRPTRLATYGYLGHMWEFYAMWTWVPAFLAASAVARGLRTGADPLPTHSVDLAAFAAIAVGGVGCVWGGWMADRIGRGRFVNLAMAASGVCSLAVGILFAQSFWILLPLVLLWGLFVVADSAQFSAMITEVAPQRGVGTALTLQTSVGFLLTMVSIQGVPMLQESFGWPLAFPVLALGPVLGIAAIRKFDRGAEVS